MDADKNKEYNDFTTDFYKTDNITDSYKDVRYGSSESQKIRFHYLTKLFEGDKAEEISLLDVGCGLAHFYDYIVDNKLSNVQYFGLDIQTEFIEFASKKHPNCGFINKSLFELEMNKKYDYLVASGIFNVALPNADMNDFLKESMEKMFRICNKGIAFNLLTTYTPNYVSSQVDAYYNPLEILKICFGLTNKINLYHSYKENDFTIVMYK